VQEEVFEEDIWKVKELSQVEQNWKRARKATEYNLFS